MLFGLSVQNKPQPNPTPTRQQSDFTAAAQSEAAACAAPGSNSQQRQEAGGSPASVAATPAGVRATRTWLDCSLPLLASDSPAIAGTKAPRTRFRRATAAPAPGAAAGSVLPTAACQQAPAHADKVAAAAGTSGKDAYPSGDMSCSFANKGGMPLGHYARGPSDTDCDADCNPAAPPAAHAAAGAAVLPKEQQGDWNLLQQLLDDSSCSSLSCIPPALAQQTPVPAGTPAAAQQDLRGWKSPDATGARELTRSVGSDITGFRGFWSATPGVHSPAAFSPAPVGQPHAVTPHQDGSDRDSQTPYALASTQAAAAAAVTAGDGQGNRSPATAQAAGEGAQPAAGAQQQPQRNTALMMLLSLEESAVLGGASYAGDDAGNDMQQQQHWTSPIPEGTPNAEQDSPSALQAAAALEAAAAEAAGVASPDLLSSKQLLRQHGWAAAGAHGASSRYTADCWPSPDGSPGVLMSSPVLDSAHAGAAGSAAPKTASRFAPAAAAAAAAGDNAQVSADAGDGLGVDAGAHSSVAANAAAAGGGSRVAALRAVQQPNALEYSPIRGLTLWADASMPDAVQQLAAAAAAANADAPAGAQPAQQQQDAHVPGAVSGGNSSRPADTAVKNQYAELQRLLTSSSTSSEDWQDADASGALEAPEEAAVHSPSTQQQQQGSAGLSGQSLASSVASKLQARSPGLCVLVEHAVEAANTQPNSCTGADTRSGSPAFYTPADTPQTVQVPMPLPALPPPSALQKQQKEEGSNSSSVAGMQEPPSPAGVSPGAAALGGNSSPAGAASPAQGRPSPLRVRTLPSEGPESPGATPSKSPSGAATAAAGTGTTPGSSRATTPVSARGRMSALQLRASPAESMDSFYGAAAGEPYGSIAWESSASRLSSGAGDTVRRSIAWQAYEGLGSLLEGEQPPTPGSVLCKKAWAESAGGTSAGSTAASSRATSSNGSAAQGAAADVRGNGSTAAAEGAAVGDVEATPAITAADLASLVSLLKQQLREAELKCTQQQLSVNEVSTGFAHV